MNNKFNMVLILSIIFLISFAGFCDYDSPPDSEELPECAWDTDDYTFDGIPTFYYPPAPLFEFTQIYPWDPILGVYELLYHGGYAVITVTAGTGCAGNASMSKTYLKDEGLDDSGIFAAPDPTNANDLSSVKVEMYSQKLWDTNSGSFKRAFWTKSFDKQPVPGQALDANFAIGTFVTADDEYGTTPLYKDGIVLDHT